MARASVGGRGHRDKLLSCGNLLRSLGCSGWTRSNSVGRLHGLEQTWTVVADRQGCGAAGRHPRHSRAGAVPCRRSRRGPLPRARESRRLGRQTKGCRGLGAVKAAGSHRGSAGHAVFPQPDARGPAFLACRDHAAAPPAAEPACHGVPIIHLRRGSRRPARPPRRPVRTSW